MSTPLLVIFNQHCPALEHAQIIHEIGILDSSGLLEEGLHRGYSETGSAEQIFWVRDLCCPFVRSRRAASVGDYVYSLVYISRWYIGLSVRYL